VEFEIRSNIKLSRRRFQGVTVTEMFKRLAVIHMWDEDKNVLYRCTVAYLRGQPTMPPPHSALTI